MANHTHNNDTHFQFILMSFRNEKKNKNGHDNKYVFVNLLSHLHLAVIVCLPERDHLILLRYPEWEEL